MLSYRWRAWSPICFLAGCKAVIGLLTAFLMKLASLAPPCNRFKLRDAPLVPVIRVQVRSQLNTKANFGDYIYLLAFCVIFGNLIAGLVFKQRLF